MPIYRIPKRGVAYSEALAEAYASAPEDAVILDTLEFRHPTFLDGSTPFAVRLVSNHEDITATLEADAPLDPSTAVLFRACRINLVRPSETEGGAAAELAISIDNVARYLIQYLDRAKETRDLLLVTWRPYVASDLTGPHIRPVPTFTMKSVNCTMSTVSGRAGFGELNNRRFPAIEYTSKKHPGLSAR